MVDQQIELEDRADNHRVETNWLETSQGQTQLNWMSIGGEQVDDQVQAHYLLMVVGYLNTWPASNNSDSESTGVMGTYSVSKH